MQSFFQGFNLARALILIFVIGSVWGGLRAWDNYERIEQLKRDLGVDRTGKVTGNPSPVEALVRQIQENSVKYTEFTRQLEGEGLTSQTNPQSYIRKIVMDPNVSLGRIDIFTSEANNKSGYTDQKFRVKPKDPNEEYQRFQIANFLYTLEADSNRVRVTSLDIKVPGRPDPETIPNDRWTFDCELTVREKD